MNETEVKNSALVSDSSEQEQQMQPRQRPARKTAQTHSETSHEAPAYIDPRESRKREWKALWMKDRAHKSKMVTGKFLFNECPGGELRFLYREFPGDPKVTYIMRHDTIHTVPLGVAMHLNDRCAYDEFQHNLDAGKAIDAKNLYIQSKVHRTNFIPLDWSLNVGNTNPSIVQVTHTNPLDTRFNIDTNGR